MPSWNDYRNWLANTWIEPPHLTARAPDLARFSTDSRTIQPGDWFLPLSGPNFDGHKFIGDSLARGANGFFYNYSRKGDLDPAWLASGIPVTDVLEAFQNAAYGWRQSLKNIKILALTGSSGKTTTKEMVGRILQRIGETLITQSSFNNEIGVPKTLALLAESHKFAAVEMGARHLGNISMLCKIVQPNVVGLINVGLAHVGEFGSIDNLLKTKLEIFRDSPENAVCIAYHDDKRILEGARRTKKQVISFGNENGADVRVAASTSNPNGSMSLLLETPVGKVETSLGLAHEAFPINAAAACAMSLAVGATLEHIAKGLEGFSGIKGRFQIHVKDGTTIIDDTYNANPESMRAGLRTLGQVYSKRQKIVILGDMLELGEHSAEEHRKIGAFSAREARPELLVAVGNSAKYFIEGAKSEGFSTSMIHIFSNVDELIQAKLPLLKEDKVIYAKGSNGVRLSRLIEVLLA